GSKHESIPAALRRLVIQRAGSRCEYCGLSQVGQEAAFHFDHIIPRAAGGPTVEQNLAFACVSCSLRKGDRVSADDPQSGQEAPLFHPRQDRWLEQFRWDGGFVVPLTATGRATMR